MRSGASTIARTRQLNYRIFCYIFFIIRLTSSFWLSVTAAYDHKDLHHPLAWNDIHYQSRTRTKKNWRIMTEKWKAINFKTKIKLIRAFLNSIQWERENKELAFLTVDNHIEIEFLILMMWYMNQDKVERPFKANLPLFISSYFDC